MIKKISVLLLMLSIMFVTSASVYASDETTPDITYDFFDVYGDDAFSGFGWGSSQNHFATPNNTEDIIDFDYASLIVNTHGVVDGVNQHVFVPNNEDVYPDKSKYSKVDIYNDSVLIDTLYFDYLDNDDEVMYLLNASGEVDNLSSYQGYSFQITLAVNASIGYAERDSLKSSFDNNLTSYLDFTVSYIPQTLPDPDNPNNDNQIDALPFTNGSIFDGDFDMGTVTYDVDGYNVEFQVFYKGVYYLNYAFNSETDMSIFDNSYESFYYSFDGGKFIVINHGDESMFTTRNWRTQTFIPYTIWNLETDEFVTYEKTDVYLYMTVGDANHIIGYFYMDEFVIDRLISVSTLFNFRWDPLVGSKSEWITQSAVLEDTSRTSTTIDWRLKAAAISSTAALVGAAVPIPGVNLGLFLVGSVSAAYFTAIGYDAIIEGNNLIAFSTNEIQAYTPTTSMRNEINQAYIKTDASFEGVDLDAFDLWKLDFGEYNQFGKTPEVDPDSISVIEMVYETNGEVYTLSADEIKTHGSVDYFLDPDNDSTIIDPTPSTPVTPSSGVDVEWYWWLLGGFVLYVVYKEAKLDKKPGLVVIIGIGILYLLFRVGLLS